MSIKNKIKSFFTMDDEYEYIEEEVQEEPENQFLSAAKQEKTDKVVSLKALQQSHAKLVICEPRSFNEAQDIADNLINRRAVVINFQMLDAERAKSLFDFLSGTVYALNGNIQKLGAKTFLCTPDNMDVTGNVSEIFADDEQLR